MSELSAEIQRAIDESVRRAFARAHPRYMKVAEAAIKLSAHPSTIHRMIANGKLAAIGSGKLTRISESAVAEYAKRVSPCR